MKKRLWVMLLLVVLLSGSFVFVGCGAQSGYNLANLNNDFYSIAKENQNIVQVEKTLKVDYSKYYDEKEKNYLSNLINNENYQYKYIKEYDKLLNNILDFTFEYIDVCASYKIDIDKQLRNKTEEDLKMLKKDFADFDYALDSFADIVFSNLDAEDQVNKVNVSAYKKVLDAYEKLLESAIDFSEDISKIYYSALNDANPNYMDYKDNFDSTMVVSRIENRAKFQTNNLTRVFVVKYIADCNLSSKISKNEVENVFSSTAYANYLSNVTNINRKVKTEEAVEKAKSNSDFFELSVQMYNAQEILNNDYDKFLSACNKIDYQDILLKEDKEETENLSIKIINDYENLVNEYNVILEKLINIMLGV